MSGEGDEGALEEAWDALAQGLARAGEAMRLQVSGLSATERADGYRALLRALHNQLARFEVDRQSPELLAFNGWRQKFFMDNPDFLYHVADVEDSRRYRIRGALGDAVYTSLTAYAAGGLADASAVSRLDSDSLEVDDQGRFELIAARERPASGCWLPLPEGANAIWVRGFYDDVYRDRHGHCAIECLDAGAPPSPLDPARFAHRLERLGKGIAAAAKGMGAAAAVDLERPNQVRVWQEMQGGAVFTEPEIFYQRGAWQLEPDEALVIEGRAVPCRYWNAMLYSRFLNSLDHRHRIVSITGGRARIRERGEFRLVLAGRDPGVGDWLDTEARPFGIFVFRWLRAERPPELPRLRVVKLSELGASA